MRSTLMLSGAVAALILASPALAQTAPVPSPMPTPVPAPTTSPAPAPAPTPAPPYRGSTAATGAATANANAPRLEAGAQLKSMTGASVGQVVSVDRAADGSVNVTVRTQAGALKTLPASAFTAREGSVATTWSDAQIASAPAGSEPAPAAAAPVTPPATPNVAAPMTPAVPAPPSATPTPPAADPAVAAPAPGEAPAVTDEDTATDAADEDADEAAPKPDKPDQDSPQVGKPSN